jgi:Flp pilus assembly protein TadG
MFGTSEVMGNTGAGGESLPHASSRLRLGVSGWRKSERGSVTIMTAVLLLGLVLVIGLSIDVGRIYMVRSGLQNAADAAALAAARELNSGTGGLADAVTQARAVALEANKYGFNRTGVTAPNVTISRVEFSASLAPNATWYDNTNGNTVPAGVESTIKFVRVTTQTASVNILFAAQALGANHTEQRTAVAGASVGLNRICYYPVAVALTDLTIPVRQLTLTFTDGTGSSISVVNRGYAVLNVPEAAPGQGAPETANSAAGGAQLCGAVGDTLALSTSNSANSTNGPRQIADGTNTRFDTYQNGYANALNPTAYPPDTNIYDNNGQPLTAAQYLNRSPFTAPGNPGLDDRRILIMPIITPGTYSPNSITIKKFGAFLLRKSVRRNGAGAGDLSVEYLGDRFVVGLGSFDPGAPGGGGASSLSIPVLYR